MYSVKVRGKQVAYFVKKASAEAFKKGFRNGGGKGLTITKRKHKGGY